MKQREPKRMKKLDFYANDNSKETKTIKGPHECQYRKGEDRSMK